jgi:hypothetical protein
MQVRDVAIIMIEIGADAVNVAAGTGTTSGNGTGGKGLGIGRGHLTEADMQGRSLRWALRTTRMSTVLDTLGSFWNCAPNSAFND